MFLLRQAVRAAGVVGVPLAVLVWRAGPSSQRRAALTQQTGWAGLHENGET